MYNTNISPNRISGHGASQRGNPLFRGRTAQGHKTATAPLSGREFTTNLIQTSPGTVAYNRILDVGWPHIVSNLDASLDLVTTVALSLPAQEASRSASAAHICSHLFPPPHTSTSLVLDDNQHHCTATTTQDSCCVSPNLKPTIRYIRALAQDDNSDPRRSLY